MKKAFGVLILLIGLAISVQTVEASSSISIIINSRLVEFTEETGFPFIDENNRTMVPLRVTMETAGFAVGYDPDSRVAIVITERRRIEVPIDRDFLYMNNTRIQNDTYAVIHNGRTFLPIRAVLEAAGFTVEWHGASSTVNAYSFIFNENEFVPFSTSSLETLVRNILNGSVVVIDGRYYSTPARMRMHLNTRVIYLGDDLNTATFPRTDRFALRDADIRVVQEWYSQMDLQQLYNIQFSHGSRIDGRFNIDVWSFKRGVTSVQQIFAVPELTDYFINAQNAEGTFDGIRMRKENGNFLFNREDLVKFDIIE